MITCDIPKHLHYPLSDVRDQPLTPDVDIGQTVFAGDVIARHERHVLHAATSGKVIAIDDCIRIKTDGEHRWRNRIHKPLDDLTFEDIITRIHENGVIGMGGAGFSTALKTNHQDIAMVIINAMECEPLIQSDDILMQYFPERIEQGIQVIRKLWAHADVVLATEDDKPKAIAALKQNISVKIKVLPTQYPSGAEKTLIKTLTGVILKPGEIASQQGILCLNVATVSKLFDAVVHDKPITKRIVTINGDGVSTPVHIKAYIGTPINELFEALNIHADNMQISQGGPIMPLPLNNLDHGICKTTNCLLIQKPVIEQQMPCINCGFCADVCPEHLQPQLLFKHVEARALQKADSLNLHACIQCKACDYVCPSHIPLTASFKQAELDLKEHERKKRASDIAKARFEAKEDREARKKALRAAKREKKFDAKSLEDKKAIIAAALKRNQSNEPNE